LVRGYCRACDDARELAGAWPGRCAECGTAAEAEPVPDVVAPALRVLFVGINPGVRTARARLHFANPANAFWGALHEGGLTPRRIEPAAQRELLALGMGITNVVMRATPGSADVTAEDVAHGRERLARLVREMRPAWLAFVGKEAHRMATGARGAPLGEAEAWEGARVFVLPSTSPRNAHLTPDEKRAWFRRLREAL
ncbi:MAG TPA: mismatch-specific DNA-glycosylase, partial [Candidatus Thermoplasmatota archaeon]|nr:mismatch-specific DNA-glycosylase [Candidatus Thermoplasmatota archaeon]